MKLKSTFWPFLMMLFIIFPTEKQLIAADNPMVIIQTATGEMIKKLDEKRNKIAEDSKVIIDIVEELLLPHFASNTIARKVLGKHSRKASDEQKQQFSEAFRHYMVRFYSKAFAAYSNQTFEYLEVPEYIGKKKVTVKTRLVQLGGQPIPIDYRMQRSGDTWKIIDIKIEGISMVISNRSQFGAQISRDGIDTVIAKLDYKNKKAQANE